MAFRTLTVIVGCAFFCAVAVASAQACFGPKLFVAAGQSVEEEVLYALVTLYVEEKTGVESTFVAVEKDVPALNLLTENKADLVFVLASTANEGASFYLNGLPALFAGKRPQEELQFTTVLPAIKKLEKLISRDDIQQLIDRVEDGESTMSVARKLFMQRRWI